MPKVIYEVNELLVKDSLECLFWIEIAKRKAHLSQRTVFAALRDVRQQLEVFFAQPTPAGDEPFESGSGVFFDLIQFNQKVDHLDLQPEHRHQLEEAIKLFGEKTRTIHGKLDYCRGFKLADFSITTDLIQLHRWWSYLTSIEGRKELNTQGGFSVIGKPRPIISTEAVWFTGDEKPIIEKGEPVNTITSLTSPVRFPIRLPARYVASYTTESHDIRVDGRELVDRIVLDFDVSKPLPLMSQIEFALRSAHAAARANKYFDLLKQGKVQPELHSDAEDYEGLLLLGLRYEPPETYRFVNQINSIRPLIAGLLCFDLLAADKKTTQNQATESATDALVDHKGKTVLNFEQVKYAYKKVILLKVTEYEPEQLPWNS